MMAWKLTSNLEEKRIFWQGYTYLEEHLCRCNYEAVPWKTLSLNRHRVAEILSHSEGGKIRQSVGEELKVYSKM